MSPLHILSHAPLHISSHAAGNEAPQASVQALFSVTGQDPTKDDDRVSQSLHFTWYRPLSSGSKSCPKSTLGPTLVIFSPSPVLNRHLAMSSSTCTPMAALWVTFTEYRIFDLMIAQARFRVYGFVTPVFPHLSCSFDLASVYSGGQAVLASDQHYGVGSNLLLPGRGTALHTPSKINLTLAREGYGRWLGNAS